MAEYVVKLADERGRIQEQVQIAGSAEELRSRFSQAGYYVYSVRPRGMRGVGGSRKKANLEAFIIFNQQFLTLIRAGLPIVGSLDMLVKGQKNPTFRAQLENVAARVRTGESLSAIVVTPLHREKEKDQLQLGRQSAEASLRASSRHMCAAARVIRNRLDPASEPPCTSAHRHSSRAHASMPDHTIARRLTCTSAEF